MEKLQAGLAGQTKPLRELGLDITSQTMDAYLEVVAKVGYTSKQLTQSDKFILRTILMLEQATASYGNFADTINSFSNQQKVLSGQMDELKLAIGDLLKGVFYPFLVAMNAVVIGVKNLIRAFVPLKTTDDTIKTMGESMGLFSDEVEEAENQLGLLSFDKFEALNKADAVISKTDVTAMLETLFDKTYTDYMLTVSEAMGNIALEAEKLAPYLTPIAIGLGAMVAPTILSSLGNLGTKIFGVGTAMDATTTSAKLATVASRLLLFTGIALLAYGIYQVTTNWNEMTDAMRAVSIGAIALGAVIVGALFAVKMGWISLNTAFLASGIGLVIAGIAIGIFLLVKNWDIVVKWIKDTLPKIGNFFKALGISIVNFFIGIINIPIMLVEGLVNTVVNGLNEVVKIANKIPGVNIPVIGQVNWQVPKIEQPKFFAQGGMLPSRQGDVIEINEFGKPEALSRNARGNIEVSTQESLANALYNAILRAFSELDEESKTKIEFDVRGYNANELARILIRPIILQLRDQGIKIIEN